MSDAGQSAATRIGRVGAIDAVRTRFMLLNFIDGLREKRVEMREISVIITRLSNHQIRQWKQNRHNIHFLRKCMMRYSD